MAVAVCRRLVAQLVDFYSTGGTGDSLMRENTLYHQSLLPTRRQVRIRSINYTTRACCPPAARYVYEVYSITRILVRYKI